MGSVDVAQSYIPHPHPVEPLEPVRGTGPSTPEGEGLRPIGHAPRRVRADENPAPIYSHAEAQRAQSVNTTRSSPLVGEGCVDLRARSLVEAG